MVRKGIPLMISLPTEVKDWLKEESDRNDRSMNQEIRSIVYQAMLARQQSKRNKQHGETSGTKP